MQPKLDLFIPPKQKWELRDYQVDASNSIVNSFRNYGKPAFAVLATGAGKSIIIADVCHRINEPVLILQPTKELLVQNHSKLLNYGVTDISMYSASVNSKEIAKFTYATIGSIWKKPELFKHFKYVIIDECHLVNPKGGMYRTFFKALGIENIIGLTATPYRSDTMYESLGNGAYKATGTLKMINRIKPYFYKKMLYKIETNELIERGYLSPIDYFIDTVDTSDLRINDGGTNYTENSLEQYADKVTGRTVQVIEGIATRGLAQRNLVFCTSIRRAWDAKEELAEKGIRAEVVTGKTPKKERDRLVEQFKAGEFVHMLNVGVFTTGFDVPELDCIILARPTMSLALYYQMVGRGVRIDPARPDKRLKVYDLSNNVQALGRVETITLTKEADGFRDMVVTERGRVDNTPLYSFKFKKKGKEEEDV